MHKLTNVVVSGPNAPERTITGEDLANIIKLVKEDWIINMIDATKWDTSMKNKDNDGIMISENYRVHIKATPRISEEQMSMAEIANNIIQSKEYPSVEYKKNNDDLLGVIKLADLHIDKLDLKSTTIKKKMKMYGNAINEIMEYYDKQGVDKLAVVNLGDYYNTDINNVTTKGTPQQANASEMDARHAGIEFLLDTILKGQKVAPTELITTPGNHDEYKSSYLHTVILKAIGENEGITVRPQANVREYIKRGNSLIGFTHGHTAKSKDLPGLMLTDHKQDGIKHRYFDKGHSHQIAIENLNGMEIMTNPAGGGMNARSQGLGVDKTNYKIACDTYNKLQGRQSTKYQTVK